MQLEYGLGGFSPQVGLHRRGRIFYQESSYWHLGIAIPFLLAAVVVARLPLDTWIKCVWVGFFLSTVACGTAPFFVRNYFGQTIIIDPQSRTIRIKRQAEETKIAWSDVVALQMCHQGKPFEGYQLNLVWKLPDGTLKRHCLAKHNIKRFIAQLGRSYESALSFKIIDETITEVK